MRKGMIKSRIISVIIILLINSISYGCFGQQRIQLGLDFNKSFPKTFMPDLSGNVDFGYSSTFGLSSIGIGNRIGFYWFRPIEYYDTEIRHYTLPIDLILFKTWEISNFDLELNGFAGFHFLFGRETYLRDTGPNWAGISYKKGDSFGIGLWPAGILGATIVLSRRIGENDIGLRIGYKHLFKSPGSATDIYNPDEIGSGIGIGMQANRWFGKYVRRKGR
jgi:hypothetical protein